jgi:hypothetical protein
MVVRFTHNAGANLRSMDSSDWDVLHGAAGSREVKTGAVVRFYKAKGNSWVYAGITGAVALVQDNRGFLSFLLVDLSVNVAI